MSNTKLVFSWLLVGIPLAYGVFQTLTKAAALFS
ncbi:MFS transporter small subunit [Arthrobacter pullicola]